MKHGIILMMLATLLGCSTTGEMSDAGAEESETWFTIVSVTKLELSPLYVGESGIYAEQYVEIEDVGPHSDSDHCRIVLKKGYWGDVEWHASDLPWLPLGTKIRVLISERHKDVCTLELDDLRILEIRIPHE